MGKIKKLLKCEEEYTKLSLLIILVVLAVIGTFTFIIVKGMSLLPEREVLTK